MSVRVRPRVPAQPFDPICQDIRPGDSPALLGIDRKKARKDMSISTGFRGAQPVKIPPYLGLWLTNCFQFSGKASFPGGKQFTGIYPGAAVDNPGGSPGAWARGDGKNPGNPRVPLRPSFMAESETVGPGLAGFRQGLAQAKPPTDRNQNTFRTNFLFLGAGLPAIQ